MSQPVMLRSTNSSLSRTLQRAKLSSNSSSLNAPAVSNAAMTWGTIVPQQRLLAPCTRLFSSSPFAFSSSSSSPSPIQKPKPQPQPQPQRPSPGEPEMPSFNLSALGLSKNMKMLVLGLIGIFGTVETWFWCKAIWHWWEGRQQRGDGEVTSKG